MKSNLETQRKGSTGPYRDLFIAEDFVKQRADLVLANLHHNVLLKLLDAAGFLQKRWYAISGLLRSEARAIRDRCGERALHVTREWEQEGTWYTLLVRNDNVLGRGIEQKGKQGC